MIRMLAWSDFVAHTGFGHVAHHLYTGLHKTGKYDLRVIGINYLGQSKPDYPFFIYPTDSRDRMGYNRFYEAINDWGVNNIDVLFLFQDIWNMKFILNRIHDQQSKMGFIDIVKQQNPNIKIVTYFPIDGEPFNDEWIKVLERADLNITYTEFGKQTILNTLKQYDKEIEIEVLPHSVDTETFHVLEPRKREFYRRKRGWENKFVVFTINRFQPRKNFLSMLRAFNLFLTGYKVCRCGNYYNINLDKCDLNQCSSKDVKSVHAGKGDVKYYLHCEHSNYAMGGQRQGVPENDLYFVMRSAGFTPQQIRDYVEVLEEGLYDTGQVSLKVLNQIYNAGDVFVTTTFGEGHGLTVSESMATGTPVIAPKNTALPEVVGENGHLVKNAGYTFLSFDNSYRRPLVHVPAIVDALEIEYEKWVDNNKRKVINKEGVEWAKRLTWEEVVKQLDGMIEKALKAKPKQIEEKK